MKAPLWKPAHRDMDRCKDTQQYQYIAPNTYYSYAKAELYTMLPSKAMSR